MTEYPEINFETVLVQYDRHRRAWGFPIRDVPNMYFWISNDLLNDVDPDWIRRAIEDRCHITVMESQLKYLRSAVPKYDSLRLPVPSKVVFEYSNELRNQ